jgi:hypothetical protein
MAHDEHIGIDPICFLLPTGRVLRTIPEQWIRRPSVDQIEPSRIHSDFPMNREISEICEVLFRAHVLRIAQRLRCQLLEWWRTLRIHGESGCVIMVAADSNGGILFNPLNDLVGTWSIVHQVAYRPELIEIPLRKSFQSGQIGMNVGYDDDSHKAPSFWCTCALLGACELKFFAEDFVGVVSRRLPDETSSGVIIRPSKSIRDGAAVQANPFALCIGSLDAQPSVTVS